MTPETGLLYWSVTVAPSGLVKAVSTTVLWPDPEVAVTVWAEPWGCWSWAKLIVGVAPGAEATTLYSLPAVVLAL